MTKSSVTAPPPSPNSPRDVRPETRVNHFPRSWVVLGLVLLGVAIGAGLVGFRAWKSQQRESYKQACQAAEAAKDWRKLLDTAQAWRKWNARDDDPLMFIAQAGVELEQLELAVDALGRVQNDYHGALQALAYRAEIQQAGLNRIYDAEATWLRMLQIDPSANLPRQRLIYFYAMTLQRGKLVDQIMAAMQLGCEPPESYTYLMMRDTLNFSDGMAQTTRWLMAYPDDETLIAAQAVYSAKRAASQKIATFGVKTAIAGDQTLLDRCLSRFPSNLEALNVKLDHAIYEGREDRVLHFLEQAPPEADEDNRFWRARGWLLTAKNRDREAADAFRRALELNPFDWQARWLLADVNRKVKKTEEADQTAQLALWGKQLQQKIFERPNARDVDEALMREIADYVEQTGPETVAAALRRRL